jgi:hypothetical protein
MTVSKSLWVDAYDTILPSHTLNDDEYCALELNEYRKAQVLYYKVEDMLLQWVKLSVVYDACCSWDEHINIYNNYYDNSVIEAAKKLDEEAYDYHNYFVDEYTKLMNSEEDYSYESIDLVCRTALHNAGRTVWKDL